MSRTPSTQAGVPFSAANFGNLVGLMEALIIEPYHVKQIPESIAGETGAEFLILPTSVGSVEGTDTSFDLISWATPQLAEAFR